ncbi:unnamed protein product [Mytilus edulis]|uniref:Uncharacterized protein n=1 Tax=Mytilus edulis TaxID=6550 RepID=A0A8S3UW49_MYTED|nr:unnamed protein product [Mytilus edulis]
MSSVIVPTLKGLAFTEEEDEILLLLSDFIGFLRSKREEADKSVRPDNLKVELSKRNLLRTSNDQVYVTFQGILLYTANHINDFAVCNNIIGEISNILCTKRKKEDNISTLDLYREISELNIFGSYKYLSNEKAIQTLYVNYKTVFTNEEWSKITIFEHQFWKNNRTELEYEESLRRKKLFLLKLKQAADVGKKLSFDGSRLIYENQRRREASEVINGVYQILFEVMLLLNIDLCTYILAYKCAHHFQHVFVILSVDNLNFIYKLSHCATDHKLFTEFIKQLFITVINVIVLQYR